MVRASQDIDPLAEAINRDAKEKTHRWGERGNLWWLLRQQTKGLPPTQRSLSGKVFSQPDLGDKEVLALALRAHGYGQKAVAQAIGAAQGDYRAFLLRVGLQAATEAEGAPKVLRGGRAWLKEQLTKAKGIVVKQVLAARKAARRLNPNHDEFIGPVVPAYWRDHEASKERSRVKGRVIYHARKNDINFILRKKVATRIYNAIKRGSGYKHVGTIELLGCGVDALRAHIEAQFSQGMNWDNYGEWHLDHIKPVAAFDMNDPLQQSEAFHYTNLRPLWARENLSKNSWWQGKCIRRGYVRRSIAMQKHDNSAPVWTKEFLLR